MRLGCAGLLVTTAVLAAAPAFGQGAAPTGEWRTYGRDLASTRYSPLGPTPEFNLQVTPLMVGGVVYGVGGTRRAALALDAATGELLWMHSEPSQAERTRDSEDREAGADWHVDDQVVAHRRRGRRGDHATAELVAFALPDTALRGSAARP